MRSLKPDPWENPLYISLVSLFFSRKLWANSKVSYRSCYCQGFAAVTHSPGLQDLQCWLLWSAFQISFKSRGLGTSISAPVSAVWCPRLGSWSSGQVALCCQLAICFICFCWVWVEILVIFLILLQIPQNASKHFGVLSLSNVEVFSCVKTNI